MDVLSGELLSPIFDDFVWSFSRINSYLNCPRAWYITYVLKKNNGENFFSQYGSFVHGIMEKYGKGELELCELLPYYENHFEEEVWMEAPYNKWKNLKVDYYNKAHKYLEDFEGFDNKVLGCEVPVNFELKLSKRNIKMCGYIDRIDEMGDGTLKIVDYKSRKKFKNKDELKHYLYQLYLYSRPLMENNKTVSELEFDMFKEGEKVNCKYDEQLMKETVEWVDKVVEMIYNDDKFLPTKNVYDDFFCKNLCGCMEYCYQQQMEEDCK